VDAQTLARGSLARGDLLAQGAGVFGDQAVQPGVCVEIAISAAVAAKRDMQVYTVGHHRKEYIMWGIRNSWRVMRKKREVSRVPCLSPGLPSNLANKVRQAGEVAEMVFALKR
jgi:hypothetical protein